MSLALFYKLFPVPKYLGLSTVGLDISDESIKYAELVRSAGGYKLGRYGAIDLPVGTIVSGNIANRDQLIEVLKQIRVKNGFRFVHASLPEEESFVVRMSIPWVKPEALRDGIELQLEEYIPLPADQAVFDYEIYEQPAGQEGNYLLGVYVAPKKLVEEYTAVLRAAGFVPVSFEIEVQSAARSLVPAGDRGTYLISDLGKTRTGFSIVSRGSVMFTSTVKSVGGENLTKVIAKSLGIDFAEAEERKIKNGLLNSPENQPVFEAMVPIASVFKDETNRHFNFWEGLRNSGAVHDPISKLIFCGGQATLPGLADYISAGLPVGVEIGNPWTAFLNINRQFPPLPLNESLRYVTALGLALRGINKI